MRRSVRTMLMRSVAPVIEDDWAQVYFAWMNNPPLSDVPWRWSKVKERAAFGHEGSCVKQPGSCGLCINEECLEGGRDMAKAWALEAAKEKEGD